MKNNWQHCKNILCIRPDNMGDLLMSGPAIRALKESFGAKITVLTSSMATSIARMMNEIHEVITYDLPWVKNNTIFDSNLFNELILELKSRNFDAAVIFTVYSQNPLPAVMLAYLAGIPNRLAYCRENPYQLLTHWVPDEEPYQYIRHQVRRDLDLVGTVDAATHNEHLQIKVNHHVWPVVQTKLNNIGLDTAKKWLILHPGVSETKREYPAELWIEVGKKIVNEFGYQIIITGSKKESTLTDHIQTGIGAGSFSAGGMFSLEEFVTLIKNSRVMLSVNTGTIHIAAAMGTPVVVLYALTNPQHTPWMVPCKILPFSVNSELQSKNEVIKHVNRYRYNVPVNMPCAADVGNALTELLESTVACNQEVLFSRADQVGSAV